MCVHVCASVCVNVHAGIYALFLEYYLFIQEIIAFT